MKSTNANIIGVSMNRLWLRSISKNLFATGRSTAILLSSMFVMSVLTGCGSSSGSVADNNNNLSSTISIGSVGTIPVLDGNATAAGIYVRNTTGKSIAGISYALAQSSNVTSLRLDSSKCTSIPANSSCLLPVTTPGLSSGEQGSSILVASFNGHQSKQLINYRYMSINDYTGVNFSDGSTNLYGTNDYATIYTFVGKGLSQNNVGFNVSDSSLGISGGLTNGKVDIPANTVVPLEIHSNQNVISNLVTVTPYTVSTSKQLAKSLQVAQQSNQILQVSITPTQQANLLMSDVAVLTQAESSVTMTVFNNGNQAATITSLIAANASIVVAAGSVNSCSNSLSLVAGASCNYQVSLNNNYSNGNTQLTLTYNNSIATATATQTVSFQNSKGEPMISVVSTQPTFGEQVNTNSNITFNIRNIGNVPLNNVVLSPRTTLTHATLTLLNNTCVSTIAANSSCSTQVNVAASNLIESGVIYLNVSGSYTGATLKNYSFISKAIAVIITDPTVPTVTSTTPQDTATAVSAATSITVNFSEAMDPTTLNTTNIQLQKVSDSSVVATMLQGVTSNNQTVTFTLSSGNLSGTTQYKIVINPSQIKDANGSVMDAGVTSQTITVFTTDVVDTTAPVISSFTPANASINQSKTPSITLGFSEAMRESTLTASNIILKTQAGVTVTGYTISYNSGTYTATLNLNSTQLADIMTYQLLVNQPNITDVTGNALGSNASYQVISFTTGDFTAPVLSSTVPINGASNVALESSISLTFSESMNTTTLVTPNIVLQKKSNNSNVTLNAPTYSNGNKTVTFHPTTNLTTGESYNIVINPSQLKDVSGNEVSVSTSEVVSNFTVSSNLDIRFAWLPPTLVAQPGTTGVSAKLVIESGIIFSPINLSFNASDSSVTFIPTSCSFINESSVCNFIIGVAESAILGTTINITANNSLVPVLPIKISPMRAYIVNNQLNNVSICVVLGSGGLGTCSTNNASGTLNNPNGIFFYNQKAYITNQTVNNISVCNVNLSGELSGCVTNNLGGLMRFPTGVSVYNNNIYITNQNNNSVTICNVDTLTDCYNSVNSTFNGPYGITFNAGYAYIANSYGDTLSICQVNVNGSLSSSCIVNSRSGFSVPAYPTFYNNYIYINNFGPTSICSLSGFILNSCVTSNGNNNVGQALLTYAWDLKFFNGYAYITNDDSYNGGVDSVVICPIVNNNFGVCTQKLDVTFKNPYGIAFYMP